MKNSTHISREDYKILHETLAQTVIDFFKERGLPKFAWEISFNFDCLEASVKAGEWVPESDCSLELRDGNHDTLFYRM